MAAGWNGYEGVQGFNCHLIAALRRGYILPTIVLKKILGGVLNGL